MRILLTLLPVSFLLSAVGLTAPVIPAPQGTAEPQRAEQSSASPDTPPRLLERRLPTRMNAGPGDPGRPEAFNIPAQRVAQPGMPRWLKEVRAQRRALQRQRRAAHQARHEALDPIGAAKREERHEQLQRRRQEVRDYIEHERRLYLNWGPWITPLIPRPPPPPGADPIAQGSIGNRLGDSQPDSPSPPAEAVKPVPTDWDNRWYYNGW